MIDSVVLWRYFEWVTPVVYQVPTSYSIPMNCGLFLFGVIYQMVLTVDALRNKNNVQMYMVCICNTLLLVFTVMTVGQTIRILTQLPFARALGDVPLVSQDVDLAKELYPVLVTHCALVGLCSLILFYYGYKLHNEFSWAIYRHVSGSRQMRRRFLSYKVSNHISSWFSSSNM